MVVPVDSEIAAAAVQALAGVDGSELLTENITTRYAEEMQSLAAAARVLIGASGSTAPALFSVPAADVLDGRSWFRRCSDRQPS